MIFNNAELLRETTPRARRFSIGKPDVVLRWLIVGIAVGLVLTALGIILHLAAGTYTATVILAVVGLILVLFGLGLLPSAIWSRRHRDEAKRCLQLQAKARNQAYRRHPVLWIAYAIVVGGIFLPLRIAANHHGHPLSTGWLIGFAIGGAVAMGTLMTVLVERARKSSGHKGEGMVANSRSDEANPRPAERVGAGRSS